MERLTVKSQSHLTFSRLSIPLIGIILFGLSACNLPKTEIINFRQSIFVSSPVGYNFKNDFFQKEDGSYIIIGNDEDNRILLTFITEEGEFINEVSNLGLGSGHAIASSPELGMEPLSYQLLTTDSQDSKLITIDGTGNTFDQITLEELVGRELHLIEQVKAFSMISISGVEAGYVLVGAIKQFGDERSMVVRLDENSELVWVRTYFNDSYFTSIEENSSGNFILSGFKNSRNIVLEIARDNGEIKWQRTFPTNIDMDNQKNTLEVLDSSIYFVDTDLSTGSPQLSVSSLDSLGIVDWRNQYFYSNHTVGIDIIRSRDDHLIILGKDIESGDLLLYKIDRSGRQVWLRNFEVEEPAIHLYPMKVRQVGDKYGFAILSLAEDSLGQYFYYFIKTDEAGKTR